MRWFRRGGNDMADTTLINDGSAGAGDTMNGMGNHSHPNGHRGDDGAAAAATLDPLAISPALQVQRLAPVPQRDTPPPEEPGVWQRFKSGLRVVFARRAWLAAVPIVLVNAVAFTGQLAFLRAHLPWNLAEQILVAVTLESVAVYLAWQAHLALLADDSALRLRLAAYGFALVIGVMNYSHWMAPGWRPTFAAVTFGLMSVSSPWLWSVHSRRVSRDALKAKGLIEPHAVRLGGTRWVWHPLRSCRVMFRATWAGESDPVKAIALPAVKTGKDVDADKRRDVQADTETAGPQGAAAEGRAAVPPRNRAPARKRKPAGTGRRNRAPEPAPQATPEPEPEPEPEPKADETVGIDAEARILELVAKGHTPSEAGVLAGKSDSYGRKVVRKARELAETAPEGHDSAPHGEDESSSNGQGKPSLV
jgi:hypothetical protein